MVRKVVSCFLVLVLAAVQVPAFAAKSADQGFQVQNAGGSIPAKAGDALHLVVLPQQISIYKRTIVHENANYPSWVHSQDDMLLQITPSQVTGISVGSEAHHRVGTAIAVGVLSLGAGLIVAATKSKKHYVGLTWQTEGGNKGGIALEVGKSDYRGIIAALEGVTGKKCVDTDLTVARKLGVE